MVPTYAEWIPYDRRQGIEFPNRALRWKGPALQKLSHSVYIHSQKQASVILYSIPVI